jgi:1-deoxy-D-xylulose-5-phosphate synthase
MMGLLETIQRPSDLRALSMSELTELAGEMRDVIFDAVSKNGGHLASNLGVVELTLALHYVYNFGAYPAGPDRLLWDVGHQSYSHKLLTGRAAQFPKLRKKGFVSGFPSPEESPFDLFAVGHAGTAISTAIGMAKAEQHLKRDSHVVAVVGDSSIVNGLALEGLNSAGTLKRQLLIVLNDNGMSISKPQGAFAHYLERIRVSATYEEAKKFAKRIVDELPHSVSHTLEGAWHMLREGVKHAMWPTQVFETLGIKYFGPLDGHDLPGLINTLAEIKECQAPILLHVKTVKGHGHEVAFSDPTKFHSPAAFRVEGCRVEIAKSTGKSWTTAFADAMIDLAGKDERVIALTAAMPDGTGLSKFEKAHPDRYIDTGICESHLAAMAAGMCKSGLRPFAAVYSTFTQRAYDQIWQEIVLNRQPVVFCMDRAGFVGDDGAVHHGFMDQAFLRPLPGMVLMAPSDERELVRSLDFAISLDSPNEIRYPRDNVPPEPLGEEVPWAITARGGVSRTLRAGSDATLIAYGSMALQALEAATLLEADGLSVGVVDARFCKPLDGAMLERVFAAGGPILTVEDHSVINGFGTSVLEYAQQHRLDARLVTRLGLPDRFIAHASRGAQLKEVGLDAAGIASSVRAAVQERQEHPPQTEEPTRPGKRAQPHMR